MPTPPRAHTGSEPPSPHPLTPVWLTVVRVYQLCEASLTERLRGAGVTLAEHEVLINLLQTPGITQQTLAARCFSAKSGISMLVKRMEQAGHVVRAADTDDRRVWRLSLTRAGLRLAARSQRLQNDHIAGMMAGTNAQDLDVLARAMARAAAHLTAKRRISSE
jgi:DNA-binding MarR family transcriptional regulator